MDKTPEQIEAWLDGYRAATETAKSICVRIGDEEADETINCGIQIVATTLSGQLENLENLQPTQEGG